MRKVINMAKPKKATEPEITAHDSTAVVDGDWDLLLIVDATYSMTYYLEALRKSMPQIIAVSALTGCFKRIGLLAYRDYCSSRRELIEWSGWLLPESAEDDSDIIRLSRTLEPGGGGDGPEALKTALAKACQEMERETLILLYADASPHTAANGDNYRFGNPYDEKKALSRAEAYGGYGKLCVDWVSACRTVGKDKHAQVMSILSPGLRGGQRGYFNLLCTLSHGACITLDDEKPLTISDVTMTTLLIWMRAAKAGTEITNGVPAKLSRYVAGRELKNVQHERDELAENFMEVCNPYRGQGRSTMDNVTETALTAEVLQKHIPKKKEPVQDFAKRYNQDAAYRDLVGRQLNTIIADDVSAMSVNPVFGSLWRAVCNDKTNEARQGLVDAFSLAVEKIKNGEEKERMKMWLEESYDYTAEVLELIESVPEAERFPCVYLDPTLSFADRGGDTEAAHSTYNATAFKRDELLEIGRSCDYRTQRRLGRVLTQLTYVKTAKELPKHISDTSDKQVPKIPMVLTDSRYSRKFWKILLHSVLPGTMLAARPAAIVAALSIKMGVKPLYYVAVAEMMNWKDKWNDFDVPETWNVGCLSLLLDADANYRRTPCEQGHADKIPLLRPDDRALFERLIKYKMLENNLATTLTARVGWTPDKSTMRIGPIATCHVCKYPRSVTVMSHERIGLCAFCTLDWGNDLAEKERALHTRVTPHDTESTEATWVECSIAQCRAQYIVYRVEGLNVRAKCHFCREAGIQANDKSQAKSKCPYVECSRCLNRMIYPKPYRPSSFDVKTWLCVACDSGKQSVVDRETTAQALRAENGTSWLIQHGELDRFTELFSGRTMYHTIKQEGLWRFGPALKILPKFDAKGNPYVLTLRSKPLHNVLEVHEQLLSWVKQRRTELGTCSLCFSDLRKDMLLEACGRSGCHQRICKGCMDGWYGLNHQGQVINTAALSCPFCRRQPRAQILAKYGQRIHAVAGLKAAVEETGDWIHAWCYVCGYAKRYVERSCARAAPAVPDGGFMCSDCQQSVLDTKTLAKLRTKKCPGCGIMSEKTDGCDHVCCTVCNTDWCFACGEGGGEDGSAWVYDHISTVHGGLYG